MPDGSSGWCARGFGDREPRLFGTVFFGWSILLAGLLFAGAALLSAPGVLVALGDRMPDPGAVSVTHAGAAVVLSVFAPPIATPAVYGFEAESVRS